MTDQSLRDTLRILEQHGQLHKVAKAIDAKYEIAAVLGLRDKGQAQLFQQVNGYDMPVVGNVFNSRERFALGLNIETKDLDTVCLKALQYLIKPELVAKAPVQEIAITENIQLEHLLPVPHFFEKETGPYISAGVIIAKDPETGRRNVSIARLRVEGGGRLMAGIAKNHHLAQLAEKAKALGKKLEIAVAIGNHPAVLLGSQMYLGLGDDEYDVVGGLLKEPLQLVKCKTVDLEVPAQAEIVLEGHLDPTDLIEEDAVSEFPGFYVYYGPGIGVEIQCVTHRKDAIYQAILPGYAMEHCLLGAVAIGTTLTRDLKRSIPAVTRVFVTDGGMGRLHAIICLKKPQLGEGKRAALLAMGLVNLLKYIVVVDDDIDPEDPQQVEWALAARFRAHEDLIVLPGVKADRCDPVHENLTVSKMALIATTRPGDGAAGGRSELVAAPKAVLERIREQLDQY